MRTKVIFILAGFIATLIASYLIWPEWFGFCQKILTDTQGTLCTSPYSTEIGQPLLALSISFIISAALMLVSSRKTFSRWIKFSIVYAIVAMLALIILPQVTLGMGGIELELFPIQSVAEIFAYLYVALSGVLFLISQYIRFPKRFKKNS